mmetsp:Transcript_10739/g.35714  ORF Transcript_10739/g.35714 Transcript_10739/m.35714 type:complete len:305 (+) Transcript_10739:413-1327(+)
MISTAWQRPARRMAGESPEGLCPTTTRLTPAPASHAATVASRASLVYPVFASNIFACGGAAQIVARRWAPLSESMLPPSQYEFEMTDLPHKAQRFCSAINTSPPLPRLTPYVGAEACAAKPATSKALRPATQSSTSMSPQKIRQGGNAASASSPTPKAESTQGTKPAERRSTAPCTKSVCPRRAATHAFSRYWRKAPSGPQTSSTKCDATSSSLTSAAATPRSKASSVRRNSNVFGQPSVCWSIHCKRSTRPGSRPFRKAWYVGTASSQCGFGTSEAGETSSTSLDRRSLFRSRLPTRRWTRCG